MTRFEQLRLALANGYHGEPIGRHRDAMLVFCYRHGIEQRERAVSRETTD